MRRSSAPFSLSNIFIIAVSNLSRRCFVSAKRSLVIIVILPPLFLPFPPRFVQFVNELREIVVPPSRGSVWKQPVLDRIDGGFHVEKPKWADLFTTNDVFDPYRFQMVSFSFVIGIALLIIGVNGLANFSIPTALLGVIGLSQVTYLGGKISAPATFSQLDDKLTAARKAQDDFLKATSPRWVTPAITAAEKAARLQAARLDGRDTYLAFRSLICPAYEMFETLYTSRGQQPNLEPDPTC